MEEHSSSANSVAKRELLEFRYATREEKGYEEGGGDRGEKKEKRRHEKRREGQVERSKRRER